MYKETEAINDLLKVMKKLRGAAGCPWDKKQTNKSLRDALIEETYETVESIDNNDNEMLSEELGDLLFLVLFHCLVAESEKKLKTVKVISGVKDKLVRRHPHVFSNKEVKTVNDVLSNWEKIKISEEKNGDKKDIFKSIPYYLPSLQKSFRIIQKMERLEIENKISLDSVIEKTNILKTKKNKKKIGDIMGEILFDIVKYAYKKDVRPENILREYNNNIIKNINKKFDKEK